MENDKKLLEELMNKDFSGYCNGAGKEFYDMVNIKYIELSRKEKINKLKNNLVD